MGEDKSKENIDVFITTVHWNTPKRLENCINSFLETYSDLKYEWYIIDNNSVGDGFKIIADKYANQRSINFFQNDKNEGGVVLNKFLDKARGRYWVFLAPDTIQKGESIDTLIKFMDKMPNAGTATAVQLKPDGTPLLYYRRRHNLRTILFKNIQIFSLIDHYIFFSTINRTILYKDLDVTKLCEIDQAGGACIIYRMDLIFKDGYVVDPDFPFYFNDVDQHQLSLNKGYKNYLVPNAFIIHDHGSSFMQRKDLWREKEYFKSLIKFFRKHNGKKVWFLKTFLILDIMMSMIINLVKLDRDKKEFIKLKWRLKNTLKW